MASTPTSKPPQPINEVMNEDLLDELNNFSLQFMWFMRQNAIRSFEPLGLRPNKALLITLVARGISHPKMISEALDIMPSAVSAMIAELEDKAWIERSIDPHDKRKIQLKLTKTGIKLHEKMQASWNATSKDALQGVNEDDIRTLLRISKDILDRNQDVLKDTTF